MKEVFELQNPWRFQKKYKFKYKPRKILGELIKNLNNKKILGLVGSRQVGKSAILYLLIDYLIKKKTPKENIFILIWTIFVFTIYLRR